MAIARDQQGQLVESAREEIQKVLGGVVAPSKPGTPNPTTPNIAALPLSKLESAKLLANKNQLAEVVAQAYHNLGVIAMQQGQADESMSQFAAASRWKSDFPGLDRNWGIVAFRSNQFEKAVPPLSRHVKAHPEDALARRMLGVSYYLGGNFKLAAETLKPAEATLAADPELAYFYGISLVQLQRQQEAAVIFSRIAEQNKSSAQAHFYSGQGFAVTGGDERAVKEFLAASAIDPKMPGTLQCRAKPYQAQPACRR